MKNIKKILALGVTTLSMVFYTQFTFSSSSSEVISSGKTEYANARLGSDHSGKTKVFLLCDAGGTSAQTCSLFIQVIVGVKGEMSLTKDSEVTLSFSNINTFTSSDSGYVPASGSELAASSSATAPTSISSFVMPSSGDPSDVISLVAASEGVAAVTVASNEPSDINGATNLDGTSGNPSGDLSICIKGSDVMAAKWDGTNYSDAGDTTLQTWVKGDSDREGIYILSGYHNNSAVLMSTLGYADGFTIPYTLSIVPASASANAANCPSS